MDEMHTLLHDFINLQVKAAFETREDIIESAVDYLRDDYGSYLVRHEAAKITDELLHIHYEAQRTWTHETDCDKLDEAFAELDRKGIVARQNFTCCQTCGHTEIGYEIDDALEYRPVRGYVFFHKQDTEHVVETDRLYLAYGAVDGKEDDSIEIGYEVLAVLRRAGLSVEWNGMIQKRICIKNIHWMRRRLPEAILE